MTLFPLRNPKRLAAFAVGLILLGLFVQWGNVPVGIQAVELMLNPIIQRDIVERHARRFGEDPLFVTAVMKVESNFVKSAKSPRGAVGLMQVMPSTAEEMAEELGLKEYSTADLEAPETNILVGTYYLSKLRKEYDSDDIQVLAAYNAGGKNVREWMKKRNKKTLDAKDIEFAETRKLGIYRQIKLCYTFEHPKWL